MEDFFFFFGEGLESFFVNFIKDAVNGLSRFITRGSVDGIVQFIRFIFTAGEPLGEFNARNFAGFRARVFK